jgi:hypothetical protein
VIVVSPSAPGTKITNRFPLARWLIAPAGSMIPQLWSLGMGVGLRIHHCNYDVAF